MTQYGFTLVCEQSQPRPLVRSASRGSAGGPLRSSGRAQSHPTVQHRTYVLLPCNPSLPQVQPPRGAVRNPAIVAQAAPTVAILSSDRFVLGLGGGENLNEHVVGKRWPPPAVR
jgi:hypothetical protein